MEKQGKKHQEQVEFLTDLSWEMKKGHTFIPNFGIWKNSNAVKEIGMRGGRM